MTDTTAAENDLARAMNELARVAGERDDALAEAERWARRNRVLQARLDTIHDVANGRRDDELVQRCGSEDDDYDSYQAGKLERERDHARCIALTLAKWINCEEFMASAEVETAVLAAMGFGPCVVCSSEAES